VYACREKFILNAQIDKHVSTCNVKKQTCAIRVVFHQQFVIEYKIRRKANKAKKRELQWKMRIQTKMPAFMR